MEIMIPAWVNGVLTPVEKIEVHVRGLRHKAVSVFVMRGSEVLIQRRAAGKYHTPGLWANTCCTHPNWGESPKDCAIRRLNEELGISGLDPVHRQLLEYRASVGKGLTEHEVVDVFVAEAPAGLKVAPDPREVMDIDWVEITDLIMYVATNPDRYTPWLDIYLREHVDAIFGSFLTDSAPV